MEQYMDNNMRVTQAYKLSGLSYSELAALLKMPRNTLACYLSGRRTPNKITTEYIENTVKAFIADKNISNANNKRIVSVSGDDDEYISKSQVYDTFVENISNICSNLDLTEYKKDSLKQDIIQAFVSLPTISLNITTVIEYEQNVKNEKVEQNLSERA